MGWEFLRVYVELEFSLSSQVEVLAAWRYTRVT